MNDRVGIDDVPVGPVLQIKGELVDVQGCSILPVCVKIRGGRVLSIEPARSVPPRFILPGLIDAHIHIESSLLTPFHFAEKAVVHGTTAVVADPHEIANVAGMEGIRYMVEDARRAPFGFYFTAPSCVPFSQYGSSGASITARDVEELFKDPRFVALGEVMDVKKVLDDDSEIMAKIDVATRNGRPVDGHCPGLRGLDLDRYIMAGISTDHETTTAEEAEEKVLKGMTIMVREGSAAQNLKALLPVAIKNRHMMVTDDLDAEDLALGHLDSLLRMAVGEGMDPVHAVRAVTMWPAEHYSLPGGWLRPDGPADLTVVSDLKDFRVEETWIGGRLVARNGKALFSGRSLPFAPIIHVRAIAADDLAVTASGPRARVRVIVARKDEVISDHGEEELAVVDDRVLPSVEKDCLLMAVINRYRPAPPALGFVRGFGLKEGAIASSVAHDAHNIIVVGVDAVNMSRAVNEVMRMGGGMYAGSAERSAALPLPVAGLMSDRAADEVVEQEKALNEVVCELGCTLRRPFMTLSFQSLVTVPSLKLGDMGLMDTQSMVRVSPVIA